MNDDPPSMVSDRRGNNISAVPGPLGYVYRKRRWRVLFGVVDAVGGRFHRPHLGVPDLSGARSILVLKLDQMGDLVLTQPLLAALRRAAPGAHIEVAVGEGRAALASLLPDADEVHELPVRLLPGAVRIRWTQLRRALRELKTRRPDVVVAPKEDPVTVLLARLIGAPVRIGYREGGLGFLLTHCLPVRGDQPQYLELAALAGPAGGDAAPPRVTIDEAARAEAAEALRSLGVGSDHPLVVVHPGSGDPSTRWPWSRFAEALDLVSRRRAIGAVVISPEELDFRPDLELGAPSRGAILDRRLSPGGLAALLARADLFVGNESGPSHLAAAVGTASVVAFFSGNDPHRWGPSGPRSRAVVGEPPVGPTAQQMAEVVEELLDRSAIAPDSPTPGAREEDPSS